MVLHIFPEEKFTTPYINFINRNFNYKDHFFCITGKSEKNSVNEIENVKKIQSNLHGFYELVRQLNKSEKIIIHSLLNKKLIIILFIQPWLLCRCSCVLWGGDLYSYRDKRTTINAKILEFFKRVVIRNFKYIITLSKNDYMLAKEWYGITGGYKEGMYINPISLPYLKKIKSIKLFDEKRVINIQIGNSADPSNLHFEVMDILKKFKDENIKIYVPLSYGNSEHAIKVKEYGENIFKDKFVAMINFLNKDQYGDFLGKIDIAIFNNNRQQALGNIRALAYLGSKIYMRDDTTMWSDFISDGYKISKINELKNETFGEFILKNEDFIRLNSDLAENTFNEERIAEKWLDIFKS